MKKIKNLASILSLVTLFAACAHETYSPTVPKTDRDKKRTIAQELQKRCGDKCEIETCWSQTQSVHMCEVNFLAAPQINQQKILAETTTALSAKNLKVGFCDRDNIATTELETKTSEACDTAPMQFEDETESF